MSKGHKSSKNMGYKGQGSIGLHEKGIIEQVQVTRNPYTQGLGYGQQ